MTLDRTRLQLTPSGLLLGIGWLVAVVVLVLFLKPLRVLRPPDFRQFYLAGRMAADGKISQIYNRSAYEPYLGELRASGGDPSGAVYSVRPAFQAFLWIPLAAFSYPVASALAIAGNVLLLALLVWKLPIWFPAASPSTRVWLAMFMPFLWSIGIGQDTLLLTLLVAYGLRLILQERGALGGIIIGLGVFKPHLIWVLPLALLAGGRRRAFWSVLITAGVLVFVSAGVVGSAGVGEYIELLQAPSSDHAPSLMGNVRAVWIHFGPACAVAAGLAALFCFGVVLRRGNLEEAAAAALFLGSLLSPHTYWQDYSLAAVAVMLAPYRLLRYMVLLPWPLFYSGNMLPMIPISLTFLGVLAMKSSRMVRREATVPRNLATMGAR